MSSVDALEQVLLEGEAAVARIRAHQIQALARLDVAQVHTADGTRTRVEWVSARLDVSMDTATALVDGSKMLPEHEGSQESLRRGEATFDRALATARLAVSGASREMVEASSGYDVAGVARLVSRRRRITKEHERSVFRDRFVAIQPNLDESLWRLWGQLPAVDGAIVEKALITRAERLPAPPDGGRAGGARRADALVAIAGDSTGGTLDGTSGGAVTVFVDLDTANGTAGDTGAEIAMGPRIGPVALERLLCEGTVQVVGLAGGNPVAASSATRAIPPATRRFVQWRDGACVISGCRSRYRLQPHHVTPRSEGGTHNPENLATLCWHHHHIAIHGTGFRLDPHSPPQRRRLLPPRARDPG